MKLNLYNTLSKKQEEFQPINEKQVGLYTCGITAYDYTHLGHLRKYVMDDILVRTLKYFGYKVKHVQNITDVGHLTSDSDFGQDKIEKGAQKYHKTVWELVEYFTDFFFQSMDEMGVARPDISCLASKHIKEQLELVKILEQKGYTYVIKNDGVYFDSSKINDYGKLAGLNKKQLRKGARIEFSDQKKNPTDFALWKFEKKGEKRLMVWESPWAKRSFPGWHIECSAMSMKYLGKQFDIHTGGIDHIPVHHTNEIAQSEAFSDKKPFVKYWVHHNFLQIDGQKMSKSLNNFYTLDDLKKKGFQPRVLRLLFLTAHYRKEMNFTFENLKGSQKTYRKIKSQNEILVKNCESSKNYELSEQGKEYQNKFKKALANDLNTAQALEVLFAVLKDKELKNSEKIYLIKDFEKVLNLGLFNFEKKEKKETIIPQKILDLAEKRKQAKLDKNYQLADEIRDEIKKIGYGVFDEKGGEVEIKKIRDEQKIG
jgi:cysteinyl-tRNA synthetase